MKPAEPQTATTRDMGSRHSFRQIAMISLPAVTASALEPVAGIVDTAFLGHLDSRYVAALAVTVTLLSSFTWIFNFLVSGVTAQIGHAIGRRDREGLGEQVKLALLIAAGAGLLTCAGLVLLRSFLFGTVFGAGEGLSELAKPYFLLRAAGMPLVLLNLALTGVFRGMQQIRLSLLLNLVVTVSNIVVTYLLLFVWPMGMMGAALGTVISFALGALLGGAWLLVSRREYGLSGRFHFHSEILRRVVDDSGNLILRTSALVGAFAVSTAMVTRQGEVPLAAHQISLQLWLLSSFLIDGFAITGNMLGSRYLGEGRPELRKELGRRLLAVGAAAGCCFTLAYLLAREPLQALFTRDAEVIVALGSIWWVLALTQPMNALVYVYDGLLFGGRDFAFLRRHMLIGLLSIFLPLIVLSRIWGWGLSGVWLALSSLNLYRGLSCAWGFHWRGQPRLPTDDSRH